MYSEPVQKLVQDGTRLLAEKHYEQAVDALGDACGAHQDETGDMDPDLFLLYGKALYESGVSASDILGDRGLEGGKNEDAGEEDDNFQFNALAAEAGDDENAEDDEENGPEEEDDEGPAAEDDDDDAAAGEGAADGDAEEEAEKSDLELAWDILEVARGLFDAKLQNLSTDLTPPYLESDKARSDDAYVETLTKLSQVYDLLGEVSLESEHFEQAASDLEKCLDLRLRLYDKDYSSLVGESHFKLSLALEFCLEDPTAKDKARSHIKSAIDILKNDTRKNPDKAKENDDIIKSLEDRYDEIEHGVEDAINQQKEQMLQGILGTSAGTELMGALMGSSSAPAAKPVNDLTSMVKKRKAKPDSKTSKRPKN